MTCEPHIAHTCGKLTVRALHDSELKGGEPM